METTKPSSSGEEISFQFSYYNSFWSKNPIIFSLQDLYQKETGPQWKLSTLTYRKIKDRPDHANEAKSTKSGMPIVIAEGLCRPHCSHASANLDQLSGLAMYDLDHCNERTVEIKSLLRQLPYVAFLHTSISGEGLKVLAYLDVRSRDEYPLAYAICQQTLEQIAGHPCDEQCARITQPCSCVWDPDAHYNPSPTVYPWREEFEADPSLVNLLLKKPTLDGAGVNFATAGGNGKASPFPPLTEACGYIAAFVQSFAQYHPWQEGNRHETMLAMGRSARRKGFSKEELEKLISEMAVKITSGSYTLRELQKDLTAGYQYVDYAFPPQKAAEKLLPLSTATFMPIRSEELEESEEDVLIKNEEIRLAAPKIPKEVYAQLPDFLKEALTAARNDHERDILLLGLLTNLSGCLPNVELTYDQRIFSPHLYSMVIAPSAAGKGMLVLAGKLPEAVDNYLKAENKKKKDAYELALKSWEESNAHRRSSSSKESSTATGGTNADPHPEEPDYYYLCGAPNTSKSQLIQRLKINGDIGLIINASELDMISGAMKQDYGHHDDVFRAAFHHEPVATDYKTDGGILCAENPHLALCFAGTPDQLPSFIHSLDNGFFARFLTYTCGARWKFRSAAPIKGAEDYTTLYKRLSRRVLEMYLFFRQSPTAVTFTSAQWEEHTAYFDSLLNEVTSEHADAPGSIVLRGALIVTRIASILTALRKAECAMSMKEYTCTDTDFHIAMDIVKTTLTHSFLLASSLPGTKVKVKPLRSYFRLRPVIQSLPSTFSYKEVKDKALEQGISERCTCRYLAKLLEFQYLEKEGNTYRKKKPFTDR